VLKGCCSFQFEHTRSFRNDLHRGPAKRRIPLISALVGTCLKRACRLKKAEIRRHIRRLFAISYPGPQRIKRSHKRIGAYSLFNKVVVVIETVSLSFHIKRLILRRWSWARPSHPFASPARRSVFLISAVSVSIRYRIEFKQTGL
jgi:hypothetical protein